MNGPKRTKLLLSWNLAMNNQDKFWPKAYREEVNIAIGLTRRHGHSAALKALDEIRNTWRDHPSFFGRVDDLSISVEKNKLSCLLVSSNPDAVKEMENLFIRLSEVSTYPEGELIEDAKVIMARSRKFTNYTLDVFISAVSHCFQSDEGRMKFREKLISSSSRQ